MVKYPLEFRILATESGWNEAALKTVFHSGLNPEVQKEMACRDDERSLDSLIDLAIRLDNLLRNRGYALSPLSRVAASDEAPMQLSSSRTNAAEQRRRRQEGLCFYCGQAGHMVSKCPVRCDKQRTTARIHNTSVSCSSVMSKNWLYIKVKILHSVETYLVTALIGSGSEGSFSETAKKLHITLRKLQDPLELITIDDGPIGKGKVTHCTEPITIQVSFLHYEKSSFLVTRSTRHEIILGAPWLHLHYMTISWKEGEITRWSAYCHQKCLRSPSLRVASTTIESPESAVKVQIPEEYQAFRDVFSKTKASELPSHRPYDCAIDLLPGTSPSRGHI